jgi:tetratricopeptide (TPR) repeat protein
MLRKNACLGIASAAVLLISIVPSCSSVADNESEWFALATDLYNQSRYAESNAAYDNVTSTNPANAEAWNNKGINYGLLGQYDLALSAFRTAVSMNSTFAEAYYNMGVIFDMQGNLDAAVSAYNKATQINPHYTKAWYNKNRDIDIIGIHLTYPYP